MLEPQIHFDYMHHDKWVGRNLKELHREMEGLRIRIKKATNYGWDNSQFFIDDMYGHPALSVQFSHYGTITFWNARNGCSIETFGKFGKEEAGTVSDWIEKISEGLTQCNECKKWVKEYVHYSFAGAVCKKCYNPKKHLPPDTRGD